jgi:hypothetical protein
MATTTETIATKQNAIETAFAEYQALKAESEAIDEFNDDYAARALNSLKITKVTYTVVENSTLKTKQIEFSSLDSAALIGSINTIATTRAADLATKVASPINIA